MRPEIFVLAGPNGAGKSTSAKVVLPRHVRVEQFVNADLIAAGLSPFAPETTSIEAGRLMLRRIRELRGRRMSFAFETTLSSKSYASFIQEAQTEGYFAQVIFISLHSVELAISRVRTRVEQGGHDVPGETIRRRFHRGLENFFKIYSPLADAWILCDNSAKRMDIIARGGNSVDTTIYDQKRFVLLKEIAEHG